MAWKCRCACGNECLVRANKLRSGHTKSCGCLQKEMSSIKNLKHGQSSYPNGGRQTKEYNTWSMMVKRCHNPCSADYPEYGGRGIFVCDDWRSNFEAFFADMGPAPSASHSIDRINNDAGYSKENCRWATAREQRRNQRGVPTLEYAGKKLSPMEWSEITGICHKRIHARIHILGWSVDRALSTPTPSSAARSVAS